MSVLTASQIAFLRTQRVGRLATADRDGRPFVVPVCYAFDGDSCYIALDAKPKRVVPTQLKRVRNILENPNVALVIDRYSEDWSELAYVLVRGMALLLPVGAAEHARAITLLRDRYLQYRAMPIDEQPVIVIRATSATGWDAIG
jgi:PPOX class probable F420-dependent enzyme